MLNISNLCGCLTAAFFLSFPLVGNAQTADTIMSRKPKLPQKLVTNLQLQSNYSRPNFGAFSITPFVAPSYSPESNIMFTAGGLITFKSQIHNKKLNASSVPFSVGYSINGSAYASLRHYVYWPNDKVRSVGEFMWNHMPDDYFGVGHEAGMETEKGDSTAYTNRNWRFSQRVMIRISDVSFVGGVVEFSQTKISSANAHMAADKYVQRVGDKVFNAGLGVTFEYDTRDFPQNAYSGCYMGGTLTWYNELLGSDFSYFFLNADMRRYISLGRPRRTLAMQLKTCYAFGGTGVPWTEMPRLGGENGLRGYTMGRFRDKSSVVATLEYRHMFRRNRPNKKGSLDSRWGYVGWLSGGSVASQPLNFEETLLSVGTGLRFEITPRMNARVDVGLGKDEYGLYATFSECF